MNKIAKRVALVFISEATKSIERDHLLFSAGVLCAQRINLLDRIIWKYYQEPVILVVVEKEIFNRIVEDFSLISFFKKYKTQYIKDKILVIPPKKFENIKTIVDFFNIKIKDEKKKSRNKKRKTISKTNKSSVV